MPGDRHDRAGSVLHQHVIGDEHRDLLAVDRVDDAAPQRHPGLLAVLGPALLGRLAPDPVDVLAHRALGGRPRHQPLELGMLGRQHEEGGAEEGVGPGREDREVEVDFIAAKDHLGPLGAADPVALHGDHVLGPGLERVEVGQQPVGVIGDLEEPLLEVALDHLGPAALAAAVDHLLVGQHGGVLGAPLDRRLGPVGEAALVELHEDPLGPAVVIGFAGGELARPVDRDTPLLELPPEGLDRALGRDPRRLAGFDRVVLRREAEGVVAHRVHDLEAVAAAEVGDRVADRVALEVPYVGFPGRVGQHLQHVVLRLGRIVAGLARVGDLPGALVGPQRLPAPLDRLRFVFRRHGAILWRRRRAQLARTAAGRSGPPQWMISTTRSE